MNTKNHQKSKSLQVDKLSENERYALDILRDKGGSMLITNIPDKNGKDIWGNPIPGMVVYKKLESMGMVIFTDENNDYGFDWTPSVALSDTNHKWD